MPGRIRIEERAWLNREGKALPYIDEIKHIADLMLNHDIKASYIQSTAFSLCSNIWEAAKGKSCPILL